MKRPAILIADDDGHVRSALRKRLSAMGYRVMESDDGLGVISHTPLDRFAAIILDHEMPNGDGRSIARVIRHETDVPIIFLPGQNREEFRSITMQLPEVYFLKKPLDSEKLSDLLESLGALPCPATATA